MSCGQRSAKVLAVFLDAIRGLVQLSEKCDVSLRIGWKSQGTSPAKRGTRITAAVSKRNTAVNLDGRRTFQASQLLVETPMLKSPGMNVVPRLLGLVPVSWRRAIIGSQDHPSRVASFLHRALNRQHPVGPFTCRGILAGYRMHADWEKFRSFIYGTWEPEIVKAVTDNVKPGMTVIDAGAFTGFYTLLFAKQVGPKGRVISFEPLASNFQTLEKNIQLNELQSRVQAFPYAVFSRADELTITVPESNSGGGSVMTGGEGRQSRVHAIALDSLDYHPDFIKMDVEGAEHEALLGAKSTIVKCKPLLLIELHHFDGNIAAHPVPEMLAGWGYSIRWIERSEMTSYILAVPGKA